MLYSKKNQHCSKLAEPRRHGRRYRRQDEAGTPFCVAIDYESKENSTVTLRFRDSMEQVRVPRAELGERIRKEIKEYKRK